MCWPIFKYSSPRKGDYSRGKPQSQNTTVPSSNGPSPTLLGLPLELRRHIIRYAFLASCSPHPSCDHLYPLGIYVITAPNITQEMLSNPENYAYCFGLWGREPMSRILRLNHQIYSEAVDILYGGDFVFHFNMGSAVKDIKYWLEVIGDHAILIKHLSVRIGLELSLISLPNGKDKEVELGILAWTCLRNSLPSLQTVFITYTFDGSIDTGPRGDDRVLEEMVKMANVFQGLELTLACDNSPRWYPERHRLVDVCRERLRISMKE